MFLTMKLAHNTAQY